MEYVLFIIVMLGVITILMVNGYLDYKKSEKKFVKGLYENYGKLPDKEYNPEEFRNISHYFLKHREGFCIDDITWNDLSMDDVFKRMNYTHSAAGEEYLYYTLRKPITDKEELKRRESVIDFFRSDQDERVALQVIFAKLGRIRKFSIYDYLDFLNDLGVRSNLPHYIPFGLILVAIAVMFVNVSIGMLLLICVLIYNNISYFKIKSEVDPYITSFSYIFRLIEAVDSVRKRKISVLEQEQKRLKACSSSMTGFRTGSFLLMSSGRMSGSGNPLDMLIDFLRMTFHLDLIKFNQMLAEVRKHIAEIDEMLTVMGQIETMIVIGEYRESLEQCCIPDFTQEMCVEAKELYHPLLQNPVKNDICTDKSVLITGSNASGKSTFLKTVAINAILAQTIHTVLAESYRAAMFRICSSMALKDDVQGGDSYYMVEIKALKRILNEMKTPGMPVLCFVDEVLRGTNTVERIAASTQILRSVAGMQGLCFAATHDIELTHLLEDCYENYHFSEEISDNDIFFSYKIRNGRATTRNAIKLLGIMGYDAEIIQKAENMAGEFLQAGKWHSLD
ncbi:MAG: hypothetical protein IJ409_05805 [Lachnospiraceae bacterium]|nr:hypothetical protein [Lachnospiraceae bacterium]